jgi:hypothetical protein
MVCLCRMGLYGLNMLEDFETGRRRWSLRAYLVFSSNTQGGSCMPCRLAGTIETSERWA